ncbi:MAG: N-acetylneuraminate synthase [Thermodesulfobacteriota bacterium]
MKQTCIIAEAGVNHNGSVTRALDMIDAAAAAGANAIKFQTFSADKLVTRDAAKAEYQAARTGEGGQYEMLKALELTAGDFALLAERCRKRQIEFLSTPFDEQSVELLVELGVQRIKIGSGDATNAPLLLAVAQTGMPVILSTGMCVLDEIRDALGVLAFGYQKQPCPGRTAFRTAYASPEGQQALHKQVTLLHCTTSYPTPTNEVNLLAMETLAANFGLPVGYSDHTEGILVSVAAAARGAAVVEKHFTLDRALPGPDHTASLEPAQLTELVAAIRTVDAALGQPDKTPTAAEKKIMAVARKSVVAARAVKAGAAWRAEDLAIKRPGTGLSPFAVWELLGRPATRDYAPEALLDPREISDRGEPS